jgi:predicted  nucleic acid-binding Zn-ribbon protein
VNLQVNRLWSQYIEFGGSQKPPDSGIYTASAWFNRPKINVETDVPDVIPDAFIERRVLHAVATIEKEKTVSVQICKDSSALSARIREAMSADPDPAKSLAEIRNILVGPTNRLHEARVEEIITILEETEQAAQDALTGLEKRCTALAKICEKLVVASEETLQKTREQSAHVEAELKAAADKQDRKLKEMFDDIDSRFLNVKSEISEDVDVLVAKSTRDLERLSEELVDRIRDQTNIQCTNFERLALQFENRFSRQHAEMEKEHKRNSEVFAQGVSDIADRLFVLRDLQSH